MGRRTVPIIPLANPLPRRAALAALPRVPHILDQFNTEPGRSAPTNTSSLLGTTSTCTTSWKPPAGTVHTGLCGATTSRYTQRVELWHPSVGDGSRQQFVVGQSLSLAVLLAQQNFPELAEPYSNGNLYSATTTGQSFQNNVHVLKVRKGRAALVGSWVVSGHSVTTCSSCATYGA